MSFRAWALFMTIVHAFYFLITCDHIRNCIGMKMADIYFIHGLEAAVTLVTVLRLYFIIEAYDIDISNNSVDVNPVQRLTSSVKRAITIPIEPRKINGNMKKPRKKAKTLKEKLRKLLF